MTTETATAALPEATPEVLAWIAAFLTDRGVELRVSPGGELELRDLDKRLFPADRATVHHYADALADWLTKPNVDEFDAEKSVDSHDPTAPRCDRCHHAEFRDVPIHDGASIRRDCARCRRTAGLPRWYGKDYPIDEV